MGIIGIDHGDALAINNALLLQATIESISDGSPFPTCSITMKDGGAFHTGVPIHYHCTSSGSQHGNVFAVGDQVAVLMSRADMPLYIVGIVGAVARSCLWEDWTDPAGHGWVCETGQSVWNYVKEYWNPGPVCSGSYESDLVNRLTSSFSDPDDLKPGSAEDIAQTVLDTVDSADGSGSKFCQVTTQPSKNRDGYNVANGTLLTYPNSRKQSRTSYTSMQPGVTGSPAIVDNDIAYTPLINGYEYGPWEVTGPWKYDVCAPPGIPCVASSWYYRTQHGFFDWRYEITGERAGVSGGQWFEDELYLKFWVIVTNIGDPKLRTTSPGTWVAPGYPIGIPYIITPDYKPGTMYPKFLEIRMDRQIVYTLGYEFVQASNFLYANNTNGEAQNVLADWFQIAIPVGPSPIHNVSISGPAVGFQGSEAGYTANQWPCMPPQWGPTPCLCNALPPWFPACHDLPPDQAFPTPDAPWAFFLPYTQNDCHSHACANPYPAPPTPGEGVHDVLCSRIDPFFPGGSPHAADTVRGVANTRHYDGANPNPDYKNRIYISPMELSTGATTTIPKPGLNFVNTEAIGTDEYGSTIYFAVPG